MNPRSPVSMKSCMDMLMDFTKSFNVIAFLHFSFKNTFRLNLLLLFMFVLLLLFTVLPIFFDISFIICWNSRRSSNIRSLNSLFCFSNSTTNDGFSSIVAAFVWASFRGASCVGGMSLHFFLCLHNPERSLNDLLQCSQSYD